MNAIATNSCVTILSVPRGSCFASDEGQRVTAQSGAWATKALDRIGNLRTIRECAEEEWQVIRPSSAAQRSALLMIWYLVNEGMYQLPETIVFPTRAGGIQFEWNKNGRELQIEVHDDGTAESLSTETDGTNREAELDLGQARDVVALARWLLEGHPQNGRWF